ncbi:MAG: DUF1684 domain-containing protein [Actinobacteria bacterium]|nr:DUF1684 domain-containing protein [Actinomycetota bacterium]
MNEDASHSPPENIPGLMDWKRRIFNLYANVRAADDAAGAWKLWRRTRDEMFGRHAQSPIPADERTTFTGLELFNYDPSARAMGSLDPAEPQHFDIATSGTETMGFTRFASVSFEFEGRELTLEAYWLDGYGGGVFLPFRDATAGRETYGGGRYLLDTVKGADLGMENGALVLDFNFAYNPSCAHDPRWVCPLAPPPNRLDAEIRAGEKHS